MNNQKDTSALDIQGHRGCRGILPENSIPAFVEALSLGVKTLEMDVVISRDSQVVVSHEPWLSHELYHHYKTEEVTEENEKTFNLYQMDYEEISALKYGQYPHPRFPEQNRILVDKPLLSDVFIASETAASNNDRPAPYYNIEIKRVKEQDGLFHPDYKTFTDLVIDIIEQSGAKDRVIIQCFDLEVLQYMHNKYPDYPLALLIENTRSIDENIEALGFTPDIYSPYYMLVSNHVMEYAHKHTMKVIPWTVNKKLDALWLIEMGVDGIITDYPEMVMKTLNH